MGKELQLSDQIEKLRFLLGPDDSTEAANFQVPSLLKEVPSFTSDRSSADFGIEDHAQLGGYPRRD